MIKLEYLSIYSIYSIYVGDGIVHCTVEMLLVEWVVGGIIQAKTETDIRTF